MSCCCASDAATACITPLTPPITNIETNAMANSIGVLRLIEPPHIVPIQLKTLMPVGTAISMVVIVNTELATGPRPTVNMWWLHTIQPMNAITTPARTTVA